MSRLKIAFAIVLAAVLTVACIQVAAAQRRYSGGQRIRYGQEQYVRRIDALERRVAALERQLGRRDRNDPPMEITISTERAEQQATAAEEKLRFSADLFRKGYISEAELEQDRYLLDRSKMVLRMSSAAQQGAATAEIAREIDVFDAQYNLAIAERQLRLAERIIAQGFLGTSGLAAHRQAVAEARKRLVDVTPAAAVDEPDQQP